MSNRISKVFFVTATCLSSIACAHQPRLFSPDQEMISKMERMLILPSSSFELSSYERYYSGVDEGGHKYIIGILLHTPSKKGINVVALPDLPRVLDGGCSVVNVKFDLALEAFEEISCNGIG